MLKDDSSYSDLLGITEEIEALLAHDGYDERLTPLLTKRLEIFSRLGDAPQDKKYAILLKRIRVSEDKCVALTNNKLAEIRGELLKIHKGKRALAAYAKHG